MAIAAMLLGFACLCPSISKAGHISGVDITYECVNACTIRVHFKAYRDCSSSISNVSPVGTLFITADSGCAMPVRITPWVNVWNIEVTPVCPGTPTRCTTPGAAINGVMEHYWTADYDFCASNCPTYTIHWQTCCRNTNITTLFLPASVGLHASTTVHPFLLPCNNAPVFNNPPVPIICQGQSYVFSHGATDPDGDSLSYSLGPCYSDSNNTVPYLAFTSPTQPLGPDWTVVLDTTTGDLTVSPDLNGPFPGSLQVGVLCIYVQEWRGGQLINTIVRDMQLTVVPCTANDPPTTLGIVNLNGGVQTSHFAAYTCLGATMCFDFRVYDSDLGQIQTVRWNQSLAALGATFALSTNPSITDTIIGQQPVIRFCWTPTVAGSFNFSVIMHDDACPIYGISQYNFQIDVGEIAVAAVDSVIGCKFVALCALPQATDFPFHYSWVGTGGLTANAGHLDSCLSHNYPSAGTFPYTLTITNAIGCSAVLQDTVVIPNNVLADAGPDMITCANQPIVIGNPPQVSPLLQYAWSPLTALTNPFAAQPTATVSNNTLGPLYQQFVLTIVDTVTACVDQDTMMLTVFPIPASPFHLQDSACQRQLVGVVYLGQNGATATYDWTFAGGQPATAVGQGPQSVSWTTPGPHEVTLTVTENGCLSPVERDTIFIHNNPVAQILAVADQCLVGNSFNFTNFGNFGPGVTHSWTFWPNAVPNTSILQNPTGIVFSTAGPKLVTVTSSEGGCLSVTDSLTLEVHPDPDALWGVVGGIQCFNGNSHQFVAHAGNGSTATYSWVFQDGSPGVSTDTLPVVHFTSPGPKVVTLSVAAFGCTAMYTDTVMVYPQPTVAAGADTSFCEGEGGVGLLAQASGGTPSYAFTWTCYGFCGIDSTYDDDPHVNPSGTNYYFVQATDVNGCLSNIDSLRVMVLSKPIVNAGPDRSLCGQNAPCQILLPSVSGTGPFTFEWFPSSGLNDSSLFNPCARPDSTTIYVLVATDLATGCSSDANTLDTVSTVVVNVNPVPIADAGPDIHLCHGDTAILQGLGLGAGPTYTYQWTPYSGLSGNTIANPHAAPPYTTNYTLVVWSNGCPSNADSVLVQVHTLPSVDAGWNREICLGESILLDATAGGDSTALYSFLWSTPLGLSDPYLEDPIATPPSSMTYFVVATSNWGCSSAVDSVTVSLLPTPIAQAGLDTTVCFGDHLVLHGGYHYGLTDSVPFASQIQYAWTPALYGMTDTSLAQPTIYPTASGMYHLEVSYATCHTHDSVLVTVIPDLRAGVLGDTATICAGDYVQLHAIGGLGNPIYHWSPASSLSDAHAAEPYASPTDTTTYTLILSEAGCQDSILYTVAVIPSPEAAYLHSLAHGCLPLTVSFMQNSSTATAYVWDFGDGSPVSNLGLPVHTYTAAGTYQMHFTAIHTGGCQSQGIPLEIRVVEPAPPQIVAQPSAPAILYLPAATLQLTETQTLSESWLWDFGDGQQAEGAQALHTYNQAGDYYITLHTRNSEGCMTVTELGPYQVREPDLFIPNVFSPNADGVNDHYLVNYVGDQSFNLEIRDRWGVAHYQSRNKTQGWDGSYRNQPSPDGVYYYFLRIGDKEYAGDLSLWR